MAQGDRVGFRLLRTFAFSECTALVFPALAFSVLVLCSCSSPSQREREKPAPKDPQAKPITDQVEDGGESSFSGEIITPDLMQSVPPEKRHPFLMPGEVYSVPRVLSTPSSSVLELGEKGIKIVKGHWEIKGDFIRGSPVEGQPQAILEFDVEDAYYVGIWARGEAAGVGYSVGKNSIYGIRPSSTLRSLGLYFPVDRSPELWLDGKLHQSELPDSNKVFSEIKEGKCWLIVEQGTIEFMNFGIYMRSNKL